MKPILPGATLGVMGSGQLGAMFAEVAIKQGYKVICYSPDKNSPASVSGATDFTGEYIDKKRLLLFLQKIDALTFEFENISAVALTIIEDYAKIHKLPVSPSPQAIRISQKRNLEKMFFNQIGLTTAKFTYFKSLKDLKEKNTAINYPVILKINSFGYDGKGQYRLATKKDLANVSISLPEAEYITEEIVPFEHEISVIAGRFKNGFTVIYPPSENIHRNGILDLSIHPARISEKIKKQSMAAAAKLIEHLNYTGVLGLEMFVMKDKLLFNEFAPRPHNSGHYTQDAAQLSQFDLQLKTMCNLFMNSKIQTYPCVMQNIMGENYKKEISLSSSRLKDPDFHLHLYGKNEIKPGRKMGHWNFTGWDKKTDPLHLFTAD